MERPWPPVGPRRLLRCQRCVGCRRRISGRNFCAYLASCVEATACSRSSRRLEPVLKLREVRLHLRERSVAVLRIQLREDELVNEAQGILARRPDLSLDPQPIIADVLDTGSVALVPCSTETVDLLVRADYLPRTPTPFDACRTQFFEQLPLLAVQRLVRAFRNLRSVVRSERSWRETRVARPVPTSLPSLRHRFQAKMCASHR